MNSVVPILKLNSRFLTNCSWTLKWQIHDLISILKKNDVNVVLIESQSTSSLYLKCQFVGHNHPKVRVRLADHEGATNNKAHLQYRIDLDNHEILSVATDITCLLLRKFSNWRKR